MAFILQSAPFSSGIFATMALQLQAHLQAGLNFLDSTLVWFQEEEGAEVEHLQDDYHIMAGLSHRVASLNLPHFVQVQGYISPERTALLNEHNAVLHSVLQEVQELWERKMLSMDGSGRSANRGRAGRGRTTYNSVVGGLKKSIRNINHELMPVIKLGDSAPSSPESSSNGWEVPSGLVVPPPSSPRRSVRIASKRLNQ